MKTILLARHGQASFGDDNYDKLSELGARQAEMLGEFYANQERELSSIVTGTLIRQQDSAKFFAKKYLYDSGQSLPHRTIADFDEFNHQQVLLKATDFDNLSELKASLVNEERPKKVLAELFKEAMIRWHSGEFNSDYDESWSAFRQRANNGLQQVADTLEDGQTAIVFTSGGVIASIVSTLMQTPSEILASQTAYFINRQLLNAGVTSIAVTGSSDQQDSQRKTLLSLNACEHLHLVGEEFLTWY